MSQLDLETRLHDTDDTTQYLPSPPAYFHHWNPFVKHSRRDTKHEDGSLRALSFDAGHFAPIDEAQLRVLQKVLERIGNQLHGETVDLRPSDYFDYFSGAGYGAFNVIFFARLHFTMTEALEAHKIICRELFSIENWINAGLERENALDRALELIFSQFRPTLSLEDWLESDNGSRGILGLADIVWTTYIPPNSGQHDRITIREAFHFALEPSSSFHDVNIQLFKHLHTEFPDHTHINVACLINIGVATSDALQLCGANTPPTEHMIVRAKQCQDAVDQLGRGIAHDFKNVGFKSFYRICVDKPVFAGPRAHKLEPSLYLTVSSLTQKFLSQVHVWTFLNKLIEAVIRPCSADLIPRGKAVVASDRGTFELDVELGFGIPVESTALPTSILLAPEKTINSPSPIGYSSVLSTSTKIPTPPLTPQSSLPKVLVTPPRQSPIGKKGSKDSSSGRRRYASDPVIRRQSILPNLDTFFDGGGDPLQDGSPDIDMNNFLFKPINTLFSQDTLIFQDDAPDTLLLRIDPQTTLDTGLELPEFLLGRWTSTSHGKERLPIDPFAENCKRFLHPDEMEDFNLALFPWYRVEWCGPDVGDMTFKSDGSPSVMDAIAIHSATTVEVLPLREGSWKFGVYSSEILRRMVREDHGLDWSLVATISPAEARSMMVLLDYVLSSEKWSSKHQRRLHRLMRTIVTAFGQQALPPAFYLDGIARDGQNAIGGGGYADTFKGRYGAQPVCLKVLRIFVQSDPIEQGKALQASPAFLDEAIIWRHLRHPNVLPFLGINQTLFPGRTCFISPYMVHGDLNKFLRRNPDHDRVSALHQVSQGLQYLHATYICHGDVKGANILVDEHLHCSLADFGITSLISTHTATADLATATRSTKGSLRWMAPEILSLDEDITGIRAAPRDVYAFGCTIIEVVSGKPPFPELNDARAMLAVLTGKRPARPSADCMTDELWQLVEQCWDQEPDRRPSCEEIIKAFERIRHR